MQVVGEREAEGVLAVAADQHAVVAGRDSEEEHAPAPDVGVDAVHATENRLNALSVVWGKGDNYASGGRRRATFFHRKQGFIL